jgi:paraquat-inducible protein A
MLGWTRDSRAVSGVTALWHGQWVIVAALVAAFVFVLPFLRFGLLSAVLACIRTARRPSWLGAAFRWAVILDFWAMPDVFLIGCAVGYSRVAANLTVTVGLGGVCLILVAFLAMLSRAVLDRRTVWRAIGPIPPPLKPGERAISCTICDLVYPVQVPRSRCERCQARLYGRKPHPQIRSAALLIASFALYLPANFYPMSISMQLGQAVPHRIIDGIIELCQAGLWPLGVVIFCTSVAIPLLKLVGLSWLALSIRFKWHGHRVFKTKLYRVIDEVGRWSNIDVFTIAVFLPVMQFGALVSAEAGIGATAFILVVVLTMLASQLFDPRLLWDVDEPPPA